MKRRSAMHVQVFLCFAPMLAAVLLTGIVRAVLQLKNAQLTETHLFVRYWKLWTVLIVVGLSAIATTIYLLSTRILCRI